MPSPLYHLVNSPNFTKQLDTIINYLITQAGAKTSRSLLLQIKKQTNTLCYLPNLYIRYQANRNYRKLVVSHYPFVIFYQIDYHNKRILVTHIFHTSANYRL